MASLYIHIPFCERKCVYCDFYSVESAALTDRFLTALEKELLREAPAARGVRFGTLYFGGGTPSLLSPPQLGRIMRAVRRSYDLEPGAEITMEVNPGTTDERNLRAYRALGVNRLSIGVQSLSAEDLRFLGRIHDAADAVRCVGEARAAGLNNVSIDLIYSIPGQTRESWDMTLRSALALRPDHVSAYSLIVEDHTPLHRMVAAGIVKPNPDEAEALLYEHTMEVMDACGYEHYEVSSYARPGFRSRHNQAYWSHEPYLGFGPSAHSFWKEEGASRPERRSSVASVARYCDMILSGTRAVAMREELGPAELRSEVIFLGLRSGGIDLERLDAEFGPRESRRALARALAEEGSALLEGGRLRLTARGYLLCDEIAARMMD